MAEGPQQTFNWYDESSKCVEGIKFDLDADYTFILERIDPHFMFRKDGTQVTRKDGTPSKVVDLYWTEEGTKVQFKMPLFINDTERVNPANPELESDNVKLSRKLGYSPVLGGEFKLSDFLKPGMKIEGRVVDQPLKPGENPETARRFKMIDINTVSLADGGSTSSGGSSQAGLPSDEVPAAVATEINGIIKSKKCKKLTDLTSAINTMGAKDPTKFSLLQYVMIMQDKGLLKLA